MILYLSGADPEKYIYIFFFKGGWLLSSVGIIIMTRLHMLKHWHVLYSLVPRPHPQGGKRV